MGWVINATPRPFYPGKQTRYAFYRRLDGPQWRCGWVRKICSAPEFDTGTLQPVASLYTDCAISAHQYFMRFSDYDAAKMLVKAEDLKLSNAYRALAQLYVMKRLCNVSFSCMRDGVVGIVTRLHAVWSGVRISAGTRTFLLSRPSRLAFGPNQPPIK